MRDFVGFGVDLVATAHDVDQGLKRIDPRVQKPQQFERIEIDAPLTQRMGAVLERRKAVFTVLHVDHEQAAITDMSEVRQDENTDLDRKRVVEGKGVSVRVGLGGGRTRKKK